MIFLKNEPEIESLKKNYESRLHRLETDYEAGLVGLSGFTARVFQLGQWYQRDLQALVAHESSIIAEKEGVP